MVHVFRETFSFCFATIPSNGAVGQLPAWSSGHTRSIQHEKTAGQVPTLIDLPELPSPTVCPPRLEPSNVTEAFVGANIEAEGLAPDADATAGPAGTRSRSLHGSFWFAAVRVVSRGVTQCRPVTTCG